MILRRNAHAQVHNETIYGEVCKHCQANGGHWAADESENKTTQTNTQTVSC